MAAEHNHVIGKEASRFYDYLHKGVLVFLFLRRKAILDKIALLSNLS